MDGEMLFIDVERFGVLKDLMDADLKDRVQWYDRAVRNRTERFKRTNTMKPMYEGAPNLVDPIIDDLMRELKQSIGLDDTDVTLAENRNAYVFDLPWVSRSGRSFVPCYTQARIEKHAQRNRCSRSVVQPM